jgi:hypothetical protein
MLTCVRYEKTLACFLFGLEPVPEPHQGIYPEPHQHDAAASQCWFQPFSLNMLNTTGTETEPSESHRFAAMRFYPVTI